MIGGAAFEPAGRSAHAAGLRYFMKLNPVEFSPSAIKVNVPRGEPAASGEASTSTSGGGGGGGAAAAAAVTAPAQGPQDDKAGAMALGFLREALGKRPEVTLDLGIPLDNPEAVKAEVKRRGLRAYELTLRVLKQERTVKPPAPGGKFRLLEQNVRLSLVGDTYPDKMLALGGDGESTVQIEIGSTVNERQENEVLTEAFKDAIEQAVKQGMAKLTAGPPKAPKSPPRKPKK
jgi:hypothetical protein